MTTRTFTFAAVATCMLAGAASAQLTAFGVTNDQRLVSFDTSAPGAILSNIPIAGLLPGESVVGIDARPANADGSLVIMTSLSRLMTLGFDGSAAVIGTGFTPVLATPFAGMDFNPTVDRVRVVHSDGSNRRLNPVNGANAALDTALTYNDASGLTPHAVGTAYNSFQFGAGAPLGSIRQLIIDSDRNLLGEVGSQAGGNGSFNGGVVTPIGTGLGVDITDNSGFDIFGPTQTAFISSLGETSGVTSFYSLDLGTGIATLIGEIGIGGVTDITVIPTPGATTLLGLAALAALAGGRRRH